ncbi:hypothetical protein HJFPF1_03827 [Paramyrothecium foliicola]|nr:hypothetical protein HJFPF1_03827 [Paramyrothecium foliicola]
MLPISLGSLPKHLQDSKIIPNYETHLRTGGSQRNFTKPGSTTLRLLDPEHRRATDSSGRTTWGPSPHHCVAQYTLKASPFDNHGRSCVALPISPHASSKCYHDRHDVRALALRVWALRGPPP